MAFGLAVSFRPKLSYPTKAALSRKNPENPLFAKDKFPIDISGATLYNIPDFIGQFETHPVGKQN